MGLLYKGLSVWVQSRLDPLPEGYIQLINSYPLDRLNNDRPEQSTTVSRTHWFHTAIRRAL